MHYDAVWWYPSAGPSSREDVIPFLENVLRGRNVPRERMLEVAEHYYHFGGCSPINQQCRDLIAALRQAARCRSTGAIATGIPCWPTRCGRWRAKA